MTLSINQTNGTYRVKGINDDESTCMHCGKSNLKKVVWLAILDSDGQTEGEVICVGVDCAASMMRMKGSRATLVYKFEEAYKLDICNRIAAVKAAALLTIPHSLMCDNDEGRYGITLADFGGTYIPTDIWKEYVASVKTGGPVLKIADLCVIRNARYPMFSPAYPEMGIKALENLAAIVGA